MNSAQPRPAAAQPDQEIALSRYMTQIRSKCAGRRAVHIHISKLREGNRQAHHLRIAKDTFESLAKAFDGQVFAPSNGDLIAICKDAEVEQIDAAVLRLRRLFSDDPLSLADNGEGKHEFCTWYDLEENYGGLKAQADKLVAERSQQNGSGATASARRRPLTPKLLGSLEEVLAQADLSNVMRRQPIFALASGAEPQRILHEVYVSMADLQQTIAPKVDLLADACLFHRLTRTLDRRMMSMMCRSDDSTISSYFSMNLNVSTLLSPEFLRFDATLRSGARGTIVIELQMVDIYGDMGSYLFARDFAKDRGYRICLDGLSYLNAPFVDRAALGVDLVKLQWNKDVLDDPTGARRQAVREMIERAGAARLILCHCDHEKAIDFGHELGIGMFQGRHLDEICGNAKSVQASR